MNKDNAHSYTAREGVMWVAHTVFEGRWPFTIAPSPEAAIDALIFAITHGQVLSLPTSGNKITAIRANEYDFAYVRYQDKQRQYVPSRAATGEDHG